MVGKAKMKVKQLLKLSVRERQIMDIIYMLGEATVAEVLDNFPEGVGEGSIQKLIRVVEKKGYLTHRRVGHSYVYTPTVPKDIAGRQALEHMLKTFFQNSAPKAVSALLDSSLGKFTENEMLEISALIKDAEKKGR